MRLYIAAARSPPESGPTNKKLRLPIATPSNALGGQVVYFRAAVRAVLDECCPAVERIVDRGRRFGFGRQCGERRFEPVLWLVEQR